MRLLVTSLVLALLAAPTIAQTKKPVAKPEAGQPYVLGTKQLPGDFGKFGKEYTIGVQDPINVVVKSASYTIDRVTVETVGSGKETWAPKAGKKYLRVNLTLKNGNPKQVDAYPNLHFTVVDANGENREWGAVYNAKSGKEVTSALKPGQAVDAFVVFEVEAEGEIPKLIVQREDGAAVVRYDLRGQVAPLPTWAGTSANALDTIAGIRDCVHPAQHFDVGIRGLEWTRATLDGDPAGDGERFLVAHLSYRATTGGIPLNFGVFAISLKTEDGAEVIREIPGGVGGFLLESRPEPYQGTPDKGETVNTRVYFRLKEGVNPKMISIKDEQGTGRAIRFDVTGQDWFTIRDCVRDIRTP